MWAQYQGLVSNVSVVSRSHAGEKIVCYESVWSPCRLGILGSSQWCDRTQLYLDPCALVWCLHTSNRMVGSTEVSNNYILWFNGMEIHVVPSFSSLPAISCRSQVLEGSGHCRQHFHQLLYCRYTLHSWYFFSTVDFFNCVNWLEEGSFNDLPLSETEESWRTGAFSVAALSIHLPSPKRFCI